jgi:AAA domain
MAEAAEKRPNVKREGELLWTEYGGLRYEINEYDAVHRTHYLRVLRDGGVVHLDRLELVSSRARAGVLRGFDPKTRTQVDRVLQHLHEAHKRYLPQITGELEPIILNGEDVEPEDVHWLWPGRVPRRKLVIFEGDPGLGKSLATLDLAACLSSGRAMPDGTPNPFGGQPATAVVLSAEDDPADTILPRFIAAGGNRRHLRLLKGVKAPDGERFPNLGDVPAIRRALVKTEARLLIVDPLSAYVPAQSDA